MRCPACGLENDPQRDFCASCARELVPGVASQFEPPRAKDRNRRRLRAARAAAEQGWQTTRELSEDILLAGRPDRSILAGALRRGLLLAASLLPGLGHLLLGEYLLGFGLWAGFVFFMLVWLGFIAPAPYGLALGCALIIMGFSVLDILRFNPLTSRRNRLRASQLWLTLALVLGTVALVQISISFWWERVILNQPILQLAPPGTPGGSHAIFARGDRLLFARRAYHNSEPASGDIVLTEVAGEDSVQRILGVPGDFLKAERGRIYRNGEMLPAEAYPLQPVEPVRVYGGSVVPAPWSRHLKAGEYAVWGVNLPRQNYLEAEVTTAFLNPVVVRRTRIRGKAWLLYYPYGHRRFIRSIGASPTEGE
jgi:signal peptidase I